MKISRVRIGTGLVAVGALVAAAISWNGAPLAEAENVCNGKPVTQVIEENKDDQVNHGTKGDDVVLLKGSAWHTFYAEGGDDTICAEGYGSEIIAGAGDDWVSATHVKDNVEVVGGAGDDTITGSPGADTIYGGKGSDVLKGMGGGDELFPDQTDSDHQKVTEDAADTVDGGTGGDSITASILSAAKTKGSDRFSGGADGDSLVVDGVRTDLSIPKGTVRASSGGPTDHFTGLEDFSAWSSADIEGTKRGEFIYADGDNSRVEAKGGADEIVVGGTGSVISAGSGNDTVDFRADKSKGTIKLGRGNDELLVQAGRGVKAEGGPGDDRFRLLTHGEVEEEPITTGPISAELRGESGSDTLSWDCKSNVEVAKHKLRCTHRKATVTIGGFQVYKANEWPLDWKDTFHGGPHRDIFYGGADDDVMYGGKGKDKLIGGKGHDVADGGPGKDTCKAEVRKRC